MPPGTAISDKFEKLRKDRFLGSIEVDFGRNILMVVLRNECVFAFLVIYKILDLQTSATAQYHTSVPTRPIYVYSFALKKEKKKGKKKGKGGRKRKGGKGKKQTSATLYYEKRSKSSSMTSIW